MTKTTFSSGVVGNTQLQTFSCSIGQCWSFELPFFPLALTDKKQSLESVSRQDSQVASTSFSPIIPAEPRNTLHRSWDSCFHKHKMAMQSMSFQLRFKREIIIYYFKNLDRASNLLSTFSSNSHLVLHQLQVVLEVGIFIWFITRNLSFREGT